MLLIAAAGDGAATLKIALAGKLKGMDIRQHGSGNIGATNAIRVLGKGIGIPVFILDLLKGWLPVWLAKAWLITLPEGAALVSATNRISGAQHCRSESRATADDRDVPSSS